MDARRPSFWLDTTPRTRFPKLKGKHRAEIAIVGGGITGVTAAALLARAGKRVVLLEQARLGEGVTGFTTAHLTEVLDSRYRVLRSKFGPKKAELAAQSQRAAIERIAAFVKERRVRCDFERVEGWLYTEREEQLEELEREVDACRACGLDVSMQCRVPLPYATSVGARFENQARFHPREYLLAMIEDAVAHGAKLFEESRVEGLEDGEPCTLETAGGRIAADEILSATDSPLTWKELQTKVAPYRSYVLGVRLRIAFPEGLFWDLDDPYHYLRRHPDADDHGEIVLIGGEDHKVGHGNPQEALERLEAWARWRLDVASVEHRWSSQVQEPVDGLPFIGRVPNKKHTWVGTGYSGNGMTSGTVAAMLLTDILLGNENPWESLFSPSRLKPIAMARKFLEENADIASHFLGDRIRPAEARALDSVERGEGKLVTLGKETLAVFRDDDGALHALAPECTHMGCLVKWNGAERSWDCPCHGSRFETDGEVIHGPALEGLEKRELPAERDGGGNEVEVPGP